MSFWLPPPRPSALETHLSEVLRGWVGGAGGGGGDDPPFFWVENHESFGFFRFSAEEVFPRPDSMGLVWGGVGRALLQVLHFPAIFAMLAVLATLVTPWYPSQGV